MDQLLVIRPGRILRTLLSLFYLFIRYRFWNKVVYLDSPADLSSHGLGPELLQMPSDGSMAP